jgi:uncharacterized membrane protein YbaN (DUF454 family)
VSQFFVKEGMSMKYGWKAILLFFLGLLGVFVPVMPTWIFWIGTYQIIKQKKGVM